VPGTYTVAGVQVAVGSDQLPEALNKNFTVVFNGVIDVNAPVAIPNVVDYTSPVIAIKPNKAVRVTGNTGTNRIEVEGDANDHLTYIELVDAGITGISGGSALLLKPDAKVRLNLSGAIGNELKTDEQDRAGLEAPAGTTLEITGGGALEAANTHASGSGAGIGGGVGADGGAIVISTDTGAVSVYACSNSGKGIGEGAWGGTGGSFNTMGTPVVFASSISNAGSNVNDPGSGIAGAGGVTVAMGTGSVNVGGMSIDTVTRVDLELAAPFIVPSGATLLIPGAPPVTLDLNGRTLTNNGRVVNNGTVSGGTVINNGIWTGPQP
jgi:hypothetical protein